MGNYYNIVKLCETPLKCTACTCPAIPWTSEEKKSEKLQGKHLHSSQIIVLLPPKKETWIYKVQDML
jgi:hypothetical protein